MIHTSYFAMASRLPLNVKPISISRSPPRWFQGLHYAKLAPSHELLWAYKTGNVDTKGYTDWYQKETLDVLDPKEIVHELLSIGTPDVAICCYERPTLFCHRTLVGQWLSHILDTDICEFSNYLP